MTRFGVYRDCRLECAGVRTAGNHGTPSKQKAHLFVLVSVGISSGQGLVSKTLRPRRKAQNSRLYCSTERGVGVVGGARTTSVVLGPHDRDKGRYWRNALPIKRTLRGSEGSSDSM